MTAAVLAAAVSSSQLARDVCAGLTKQGQKEINCRYLYDDVGSALFEAITYLPEYGLTRAEERILRRHSAEIVEDLPAGANVVELGSGSGRKTRHVLAASRNPVYWPIDVSRAALEMCVREMREVAEVKPVRLPYLEGLAHVAGRRRGDPLLLLFLGSTIGNFRHDAAVQFLKQIRAHLLPGDRFLIGADLVKDAHQLILAYNDPAGVTAAFNRNLLARLNRELEADFAVDSFVHEARYDAGHERVEMHLRAVAPMTVRVGSPPFTVTIAEGETIWTESSYKFRPESLERMARESGFRSVSTWVDEEWPFADCLWQAV